MSDRSMKAQHAPTNASRNCRLIERLYFIIMNSAAAAQMLLQPVKLWTPAHLQAANLDITQDADPASIMDAAYLPADGDKGMV